MDTNLHNSGNKDKDRINNISMDLKTRLLGAFRINVEVLGSIPEAKKNTNYYTCLPQKVNTNMVTGNRIKINN